jgi:hypothetical protein
MDAKNYLKREGLLKDQQNYSVHQTIRSNSFTNLSEYRLNIQGASGIDARFLNQK